MGVGARLCLRLLGRIRGSSVSQYYISEDEAFRRMEKVLVRKERARLIRAGIIVPAGLKKAQRQVQKGKDNG